MMKQLSRKKYNPKLHVFLIFTCLLCAIAAIVDLYFIYKEDNTNYINSSIQPITNTGHYYQMMPKEMQLAYLTLYKGISTKKTKIKLSVKEEYIKRIFYCLMFDNPELIYLSDVYSYDAEDGIVTMFYPNYTIKSDEIDKRIKQINAEVQKLKEETSELNSYEKELFIHKYLLEKCSYSTVPDVDTTLYGAIINGETNCRGYSAAYSYLLNSCGVKAGQCIGTVGEGDEKEGHSWNFVILDDEYYYCDVCWNDIEDSPQTPKFHYSFFNMTYEEMCQSHNFENQNAYLFNINKTNSGKYSYMKQNGLYAKTYEEACDIIKSKLPKAIKLDKPLMIQMENEMLYNMVDENLNEIVNNVININKLKMKYCKYMKIKNGNTIIIYKYS